MAFVRWEEKVISSDKGRRLVHYYLRDGQGRKVLAVVGREKSLRHMSYAVTAQFSAMMGASFSSSLCSYSPSSALDFGAGGGVGCLKWKSRRELIDWLSSIVSDNIPCTSLTMDERFSDEEAEPPTILASKGLSSGKLGHLSKAFSWLGSAWDCRKKRKHYRSFRRNGITISVHDFVYVMAEECKRLVAYVEDLYEDMRANKMVVVRWFHKVDEVGTGLPSDISDREIFFSLCLQDLSVECIDGLAAVLSVQDFDKFHNEARHRSGSWEPHLCRRQIDNDDVKPFDITQVQGYWSQELLRSMYATPGTSLKLRLKITHSGSRNNPNKDGRAGPKEKSRLNDVDNNTSGAVRDANKSNSTSTILNGVDNSTSGAVRNANKTKSASVGSYGINNSTSGAVRGAKKSKYASAIDSRGEKQGRTASVTPLLRKELLKAKLQQQQKHIDPGCHVEVLSQDSGIRGCWFRCVVLKRHHDKVKVRYEDVQDADDAANLEEWVLSSRVASPDKLGMRLPGRPVVRPDPPHCSKDSCSLEVGSSVDAWWHDGWWEGIVISKEAEGKLRVYFPGEQQVSIFGLGDLRHSQEWISNKWNLLIDRPEVASSLLSDIDRDNRLGSSCDREVPVQASGLGIRVEINGGASNATCNPESALGQPSDTEKREQVPDLSEVCLLDSLKWSSSRKRRRARELGKGKSRTKRQCRSGSSSSSSQEDAEGVSNACSNFLLSKTMAVVDNEMCKIGGSNPMLVTPIGLCSNLVMSQ